MSFIVHARNFWNLNPLEDEKIRIVGRILSWIRSLNRSFVQRVSDLNKIYWMQLYNESSFLRGHVIYKNDQFLLVS